MANSNENFGSSLFDNDNAYQADLAKAKASDKKPKRVTRKKEKIGHVGEIDTIVKKQEEDGRRRAKEYDKLKQMGLTKDIFESIIDECIERYLKTIV